MRRALWIILVALASNGSQPVFAGEQTVKSYILVDVEKVSETEIKGLSIDGYLTIARYDPTSNDLLVSARKWKAGKAAAVHDRAIAVRSPVQKLHSTRQFLLEVEPGTWIIESANGTVFSKGSWAFHVPEGVVVDLGVFKPVIGWQKGDKRESLIGAVATYAITPNYSTGQNSRPKSRPVHLEWHKRQKGDVSLPPDINGEKVIEASFTRASFQNYLPRILNIDGFTNCIDAVVPVGCEE